MTFYTSLYHRWKSEHNASQLLKLETDFFIQARNYLNHLQTQSNNEDSLIAELFKERLSRATYLLEDLITIRLHKHFQEIILQKENQILITSQEIHLRSNLEKLITEFRDTIVGTSEPILEDKEYVLTQIVEQLSNMGVLFDLREYGPFYPKDIVYMPSETARNLEKRNEAKRIRLN